MVKPLVLGVAQCAAPYLEACSARNEKPNPPGTCVPCKTHPASLCTASSMPIACMPASQLIAPRLFAQCGESPRLEASLSRPFFVVFRTHSSHFLSIAHTKFCDECGGISRFRVLIVVHGVFGHGPAVGSARRRVHSGDRPAHLKSLLHVPSISSTTDELVARADHVHVQAHVFVVDAVTVFGGFADAVFAHKLDGSGHRSDGLGCDNMIVLHVDRDVLPDHLLAPIGVIEVSLNLLAIEAIDDVDEDGGGSLTVHRFDDFEEFFVYGFGFAIGIHLGAIHTGKTHARGFGGTGREIGGETGHFGLEIIFKARGIKEPAALRDEIHCILLYINVRTQLILLDALMYRVY